MADDDAKKAAFEWQLGAKVLSGDWGDETAVSLKINYDLDLLREFFYAGWDHAKHHREAPDGSD